MTGSASMSTDEKPKRGRPATVTREEYDNLVACVEKLASLTGNGNMLKQYGFVKWEPNAADMRKYR